MCDGADAAGGGACSHLAFLKSLEITLEEDAVMLLLLSFNTVRKGLHGSRMRLFLHARKISTDRCQDVPGVAF